MTVARSVVFMPAFAVLLLGGPVGAGEPDHPVFDIPRMEKVIIDGKADDWGDGGFRLDLLMPMDGQVKPTSDHDARIRLGWNDDGLLLLMFVHDDRWVEHPSREQLWQYDAIEMFLASQRGAPGWCQWIIAPGMDPQQPSLRWKMYDLRNDASLKKLPADPTAARTPATALEAGKTKDRYVLEVLLPFKPLGIKGAYGREIGFQVWVNDSDRPDGSVPCPYRAGWYLPFGRGSFSSEQMHRLRLAKRAGPAVTARAMGGYDLERVCTRIAVAARREHAGKAVAAIVAGKTLATSKLAAAGAGPAEAQLRLPMPPKGKPYGPVTIQMAGEPADLIVLPNADRERAETLLWSGPVARPSVFSGSRLPAVQFERPLSFEALIGPYTLKTTYYDKDYHIVTVAEAPGRYGAVTEITIESGRTYRRFRTLFRTPEAIGGSWEDLKIDLMLPKQLGILPEAVAAHRDELTAFVKRQIGDSFGRHDDGARLLAGLHETKATDPKGSFYSSPRQRDRQWWVGLKRKLYGWDQRWPDPFVCPRPIEGAAAPVVREGTAADAGMKPDAAAQIDAVLTQWAKDTDEAFAVCIVRHGVIVLHKAYGTRGGRPMTLTDKSWMASTTKMISGACMMMLVDQGLIDLDDRADKYLPPLRGCEGNRPLTIRHLYTHTNGMDWHWGAEANDMEERIAALIPHYEVGVRYAYNGTGLELACKILEAVTGESLPNFYRNHLLGPLGCENIDIPNASSGAMSVPLDMAKIGQMLLNRGVYGKMQFMSEETFEKMLPQKLTKVLGPDTDQVYGIGTTWYPNEGLGDGTFAHGAASSATTRIDPVNDLVIIMTRNSAGRNFAKYHRRFIDAVVAGMDD